MAAERSCLVRSRHLDKEPVVRHSTASVLVCLSTRAQTNLVLLANRNNDRKTSFFSRRPPRFANQSAWAGEHQLHAGSSHKNKCYRKGSSCSYEEVKSRTSRTSRMTKKRAERNTARETSHRSQLSPENSANTHSDQYLRNCSGVPRARWSKHTQRHQKQDCNARMQHKVHRSIKNGNPAPAVAHHTW